MWFGWYINIISSLTSDTCLRLSSSYATRRPEVSPSTATNNVSVLVYNPGGHIATSTPYTHLILGITMFLI